MNGRKNNDWLKEFKAFTEGDVVQVPAELNERVAKRMEKLLNPSAWVVFLKVLAIHSVVGFLSLAICHQFDLNPFGTSRSLDNWFMSIGGHSVCMIGCGILFLSVSVLASGYFLSLEEARSLRRTGFPQSFALGTISLVLFSTVGAELALTFSGLWLLGALIGGYLATETVWKLKYARVQRLQRI